MLSNFQKVQSLANLSTYSYILVHTDTYWYRNTFHLNQALSAFRLCWVSAELLACSSRRASFFTGVFSTVRPPMHGFSHQNHAYYIQVRTSMYWSIPCRVKFMQVHHSTYQYIQVHTDIYHSPVYMYSQVHILTYQYELYWLCTYSYIIVHTHTY